MSQGCSCHVEPIKRQAHPEAQADQNETWLSISGMGCPNCAARVTNALLSNSGVVQAQVDHQSGTARVRHNPGLVLPADLLPLVESAGDDGHHVYRAALM